MLIDGLDAFKTVKIVEKELDALEDDEEVEDFLDEFTEELVAAGAKLDTYDYLTISGVVTGLTEVFVWEMLDESLLVIGTTPDGEGTFITALPPGCTFTPLHFDGREEHTLQ